MTHRHNPETNLDHPPVYQMRINGHLGPDLADRFDGMTITQLDNGDTLLTGPMLDQAALHGMLRKVRDVGLPLVSVLRLKPEPSDASACL